MSGVGRRSALVAASALVASLVMPASATWRT
jgi:hypothetical protein